MTLHAVVNAHLELARQRKAEKLVGLLRGFAKDAPEPVSLDDLLVSIEPGTPMRDALLALAGFESASEETWAIVRRLLSLGGGV